ncbi:Glycyl-tRNA synthetase beta chain [Alkalibacterium sp. AK22]|uniref:glycine--tRNA ligase subunit beta n=1 Tax=Alkalibacterium sp. AK22 TaxID=1229520 RepID=UPI00044DF9E3|nr:glycine--tRNA ligase subunit beta [Alkalibacterium sp. AK22]EXJ22471.1 Glycyl-tRNA synthetase beta chain [Alkalibacterium sp. AK22]
MTHTLLLEIGLEEMPAKVIVPGVEYLKEKVAAHFSEHELKYETIETFSTPRRLAVKVSGLSEKQADRTETVKGPAKRIALDKDGNWSKAAIGFTRGQKATVEDIVFKEVKGEEYVFVQKHVKGQTAAEVTRKLSKVIASIPFPVSMKWGTHAYRYIRPVHWLTAMLDEQVVDMDLFDVQSGRTTEGHRFLGGQVTLTHAKDYPQALEAEWVVADRSRRQNLIREQISSLCKANNWESPLDNQELLDEVTDLVEYPTAFSGAFSAAFLNVPESVLETAMADHQRYFPVRKADQSRSFLPYFIGVRNGNAHAIDKVKQGNEKVLSARLSDAAFFYQEDQKLTIDEFVEKLASVSFHEKLGSLLDKQRRLTKIAQLLSDPFNLDTGETELIERAGRIAKFDLVTQTVNEFTSLQGEIAGIFAEERGEDPNVSTALAEQYLPKSMDGKLPKSRLGAVISVADKLDSLLSFFSVNLIPSGSNDPFALRRQAMGIVRIIKAFDLSLSLDALIDQIAETVDSTETKAAYIQCKSQVIQFINDRLDQLLSVQYNLSGDYDIRQAALGSVETDINKTVEAALLLKEVREQESFKAVVESLTRVSNLAGKVEKDVSLSEALLKSESEQALYAQVLKSTEHFVEESSAKDKWEVLSSLHPLIDDFFDQNMVMTDDEAVKNNRLALLKAIDGLSRTVAAFDRLVIK